MSKGLSAEKTTIAAWQMAIKNRPVTQKTIFHSDSSIQYACSAFTNVLNANKWACSNMSRKGNQWDNAIAESFFKTIKVEFVYENPFSTHDRAKLSLFNWIETWYNKKRRHSALGSKRFGRK